MRVTHDNWRLLFIGCPIVRLDGAVIDHVVVADDADGFVDCYRYGPDGHLLVNGDELMIQRVTGSVEIIGERRSDV
jgi:hypothetical protein